MKTDRRCTPYIDRNRGHIADTAVAGWAVVDRVLKDHPASIPYRRGSGGPKEADALIAEYGSWHKPAVDLSPKEEQQQPEDVEQRTPSASPAST